MWSLFLLQASLLVILLIFWQVPHFFLVLLNHKKDYLESVAPNMLQMFKENFLQRIFISWIGALAVIKITFTIIPIKLSNLPGARVPHKLSCVFGKIFCYSLCGWFHGLLTLLPVCGTNITMFLCKLECL